MYIGMGMVPEDTGGQAASGTRSASALLFGSLNGRHSMFECPYPTRLIIPDTRWRVEPAPRLWPFTIDSMIEELGLKEVDIPFVREYLVV